MAKMTTPLYRRPSFNVVMILIGLGALALIYFPKKESSETVQFRYHFTTEKGVECVKTLKGGVSCNWATYNLTKK